MALIEVHKFYGYNPATDEFIVSSRMAPRDVIAKLRVEGVVPGTAILVDETALDGNRMTPRNFIPT